METTFRELAAMKPCKSRYVHFVKAMGGVAAYGKDTPINFLKILEHNGLDDTLWALEQSKNPQAAFVLRIFAVGAAFNVLKYYENAHPNDKRPREAIIAAHLFAYGEIEEDSLNAARATAWTAAWAAAWYAAWTAAGDAVRAAARAAAIDAAWYAARDAAWAAAGEAEKQFQHDLLKRILEEN